MDDTQRIIELRKTVAVLEQDLSDPGIFSDAHKVRELSIALTKAQKELSRCEQFAALARQKSEAKELAEGGNEEMAMIAREELERLAQEEQKLLSGDEGSEQVPSGPKDVIIEIRAGTGGEEAALFAHSLFQMYTRFAQTKGWRVTVLNESKSDLRGYKEVTMEITGKDVYQLLKWESGVHRVQRIPETEKTGRIHTSTASVAVLPKAREVDLEIKPGDIKIEFFRSSGPGGQNVNKVETAVRIYHLPTGLIVTSQESRSQQKNREQAFTILRTKLLDAKIQEEARKMAAERKQQIGTGDRSEKIRTYNFPQDRVTDHRIKESWHNLPAILEGEIDAIVEALQKKEKEEN